MGDIKVPRVEHLHHLDMDLHGRALQAPAVDAQEHIHRSEGDGFVAVDEGVVDVQTFEQGSRLGKDVFVVARPWPENKTKRYATPMRAKASGHRRGVSANKKGPEMSPGPDKWGWGLLNECHTPAPALTIGA